MKSGVSARVPRKRAAECVSGVLISDGAVLVLNRRADDDADPGLILLPGGHVEVGESLNQALKREMQEEIGIKSEGSHPFASSITRRRMERQRIHYLQVKDWKGKINVERSRGCLLGIRY
jgi:8-oxo-dGTP diphosphatase